MSEEAYRAGVADARQTCARELQAFADAVLAWSNDRTASATILGSIIAGARATAEQWTHSGALPGESE